MWLTILGDKKAVKIKLYEFSGLDDGVIAISLTWRGNIEMWIQSLNLKGKLYTLEMITWLYETNNMSTSGLTWTRFSH